MTSADPPLEALHAWRRACSIRPPAPPQIVAVSGSPEFAAAIQQYSGLRYPEAISNPPSVADGCHLMCAFDPNAQAYETSVSLDGEHWESGWGASEKNRGYDQQDLEDQSCALPLPPPTLELGAIVRAACLRQDAEQWVRVRAWNNLGYSDWSDSLRIAVMPSPPDLKWCFEGPANPGVVSFVALPCFGSASIDIATSTVKPRPGWPYLRDPPLAPTPLSQTVYEETKIDTAIVYSVLRLTPAVFCLFSVRRRGAFGLSAPAEVLCRAGPSPPVSPQRRLLHSEMADWTGLIPPLVALVAEYAVGVPFPVLPALPSDYKPSGQVDAISACKRGDLLELQHWFGSQRVSGEDSSSLLAHVLAAASAGQLVALQFLLSRGAPVIGHAGSALSCAIAFGHEDVVDYLLTFYNTNPPVAYHHQPPEPLSQLRAGLTDRDCLRYPDGVRVKGLTCLGPLDVAVLRGNLRLVQRLMQEFGAQLSSSSLPPGETCPLYHAIRSQHLHIVKYLVEEQRVPFDYDTDVPDVLRQLIGRCPSGPRFLDDLQRLSNSINRASDS